MLECVRLPVNHYSKGVETALVGLDSADKSVQTGSFEALLNTNGLAG